MAQSFEDVIQKLMEEADNLAKQGYRMSTKQQELFDKMKALFADTDEAKRPSSSSQQRRLRNVSKMLVSIVELAGYEVALLCMISVSISRLAELLQSFLH